ncbi:MAG: hypothetical protein ABIO83_05695 [Ilumatobacteraceae bacterium]
MPGRYTSRVFVAGTALRDALETLDFPPFQGKRPPVRFGDADPDYGNEVIGVALDVERQQIQWARVGPAGRDETLFFSVVHRLMAPNIKNPIEVWERLGDVAELVQSILYDTDTEDVLLLGFAGEVKMGMVGAVVPQVAPGPDGWIGVCTTSFELRTRI